MTEAMQQKIEELLAWRDRLLLSNMDWTRLTKDVDADGVNYQTIRRIERGGTPYGRTLHLLEDALRLEEMRQHERNRNITSQVAAGRPGEAGAIEATGD